MKAEFSAREKGSFAINLVACGYCENENFDIESISEENYRVFCINRGVLNADVDGLTHYTEKDGIAVLFPHSKITLNTEVESVFYICLSGCDVPSYLSELSVNSDTVAVQGNMKLFNACVMKLTDFMLSETAEEKKKSTLKVSSMLLEALSYLDSESAGKISKAGGHVSRAISYINANYTMGITAGDVSCLLGIDRTHFFRIFKKRTGLSPEQYIIKKRVERAKLNLKNSEMTIADISADVGMKDIFYFSKLFKKEVGVSPTEYRKSYRNR